jgi:predicted Fe-S protein YdhL (DUF1289 family)
MSDEVWSRREIASPCNRICMIHPGAGICVGCYRTGDEIAGWSRLSDERREELMAELPSRAARLTEAGARPSARRKRG